MSAREADRERWREQGRAAGRSFAETLVRYVLYGIFVYLVILLAIAIGGM
jgi:hypothetical protein